MADGPALEPARRDDALRLPGHPAARARAAGSLYEAAVVNPTFSGALPISATTLAMFTDRNATIVRADGAEPEVTTDDPAQGTYAAALSAPARRLSLEDGRASTCSSGHRWYTVIDTHLERSTRASARTRSRNSSASWPRPTVRWCSRAT